MDSSFTLVEEQRGSGRAQISCIGRDIEYQELELRRSEENVRELISGDSEQIGIEEMRLTSALTALLDSRSEFIGVPTQLSDRIDPDGTAGLSPKRVARRLIGLHRAESVEPTGGPGIDSAGTQPPAEIIAG